ncbi:PhzF family phenazine biosynthesis protein [Mycobacterium sp. CSUR Q5927]|nr:PhzF family phenazine biosynthesis protein [Mycobacterium sp. CSUR Q5927]
MTQLFTVDCFTDRPFTGNPTAVCLLESEWPETEWMQSLSAELGLPATAFVNSSQPRPGLRWFSPNTELELCGSGTLAAAHILGHNGYRDDTVIFTAPGGTLVARYESDGRITLDFPADHPQPLEVPDWLTAALGVRPVAVARGRLDLLAELDTADAVHALDPDLAALAMLDVRGVIVTAIAETDCDFVSRFFAPAAGIDEDPVTGSAHCTLGPYWSPRLGKTALSGRQVSARGGRVDVQVRGDRVDVLGRAVTISRGELAIPNR